MNKKILFVILIICIIILNLFIFFFINKSKKNKVGNTTNSQDIIENILNISSYTATIEVEVNSNKNVNKYIINQKYISPNISEQEIIEPENIKGIKIVKQNNELKIENSKLNLVKIYKNYEEMLSNYLDLNVFIEKYKTDLEKKYEENKEEIILKLENKENKYKTYLALYINKNEEKPTKMEIKDYNKKTVIYILYKEIELKK